jgi:2TM domain
VPSELLTKNEQTPMPAAKVVTDSELREAARRQVERVRRLKMHVAAYVVGMILLTPIWALTQWATSGSFERWSTDHSQPGDWEPWIVYVALGWGLVVAIIALKTYFGRPTSEAEIDREVERMRSRR